MTLVCRIQDADGRGPYKPGFSQYWVEDSPVAPPLPITLAFPDVMEAAHKIVTQKGGACGCAFRTLMQASAWFTPSEILTLAKLGYSLCWMKADEVIAENKDQLVIWTQLPLAKAVIQTGWRTPQ
jgi:hypothetical protein